MCEDVARDSSLTSRHRGRHSTPLQTINRIRYNQKYDIADENPEVDKQFVSHIENALHAQTNGGAASAIVMAVDGARANAENPSKILIPGLGALVRKPEEYREKAVSLLLSVAYGEESLGAVVDYPLVFHAVDGRDYYSLALVALASSKGLQLDWSNKGERVTLDHKSEKVFLIDAKRELKYPIDCYSVRKLDKDVEGSSILRKGASIASMRIEVSEGESRKRNWMSGKHVLNLKDPTKDFAGKLVIMGDQLEGVDSYKAWNRFSKQQLYGVELHAEALSALVNNTDLRQDEAGAVKPGQRILTQPSDSLRWLLLIISSFVGVILYLSSL